MRCWQSWLLWIWVVDPSNCFPVSCNDTSLFAQLLLLGSVDHALLSRQIGRVHTTLSRNCFRCGTSPLKTLMRVRLQGPGFVQGCAFWILPRYMPMTCMVSMQFDCLTSAYSIIQYTFYNCFIFLYIEICSTRFTEAINKHLQIHVIQRPLQGRGARVHPNRWNFTWLTCRRHISRWYVLVASSRTSSWLVLALKIHLPECSIMMYYADMDRLGWQ